VLWVGGGEEGRTEVCVLLAWKEGWWRMARLPGLHPARCKAVCK
jgi:hypothetical protein